MAVTNYAYKRLLQLLKSPVPSHGKVLTLSKYGFPRYKTQQAIADSVGFPLDIDKKYLEDRHASDVVSLKALGFDTVTSVDNSEFEGCDRVLDLNLPIPEDMRGQYQYVIDAGTMEHIFNFRATLRNIHRLLARGGVFVYDAPYWWEPYHGFYNFSPEVFSRYFSVNNWELIAGQAYAHDDTNGDYSEICGTGKGIFPARRGLVWGAVRKHERSTWEAIPQQGVYDEQWARMKTAAERVKSLAKMPEPLYFFGTGRLTKHFADIAVNARKSEIGICSDNPAEIGVKFYLGLRTEDIRNVPDGANVVIASEYWENGIFERIGKHGERIRIQKVFATDTVLLRV
jgi:SAM-dependent methyltransferase